MSAKGKSLYKKKLGVYYTPIAAARILCDWAIQKPNDFVLEPSFGACGFLEACKERFLKLKTPSPIKQLYGCDTDEMAFSEYLQPKFGLHSFSSQFIKGDFLQVQPNDFKVKKFEAIVGNPPYVSYHNMSQDQRVLSTKVIEDMGFKVPKISSLWLFFVMHSINFLKKNGRIAWVLPSSFVHADYSKFLRNFIEKNFERSIAVQIGQRLFTNEGTEEVSIMLFAEGFKQSKGEKLKIAFAPSLKHLKTIVDKWKNRETVGKDFSERMPITSNSEILYSVIKKISSKNRVHLLGDLADIRIGIVTGANKFFIINKETVKNNKLPKGCLSFILSKAHFCKGLNLTIKDLEELKEKNLRCLFIDTSNIKRKSKYLQKYLDSFPEKEKENNKTFQKHSPWHNSNDGKIPDAFLSYMCQERPSLILNNSLVNATNSIHRIYFKSNISLKERKLISISLLSSFGQLSAEIEGRNYGSGVLKLEPSEAKRIKILLPEIESRSEINTIFNKINTKLRQAKGQEAIKIADDFILQNLSVKDKIIIDKALIELRNKRKRK